MVIDYLARLDALRVRSEADLVAFVPGENMVYFTGLHFHLSERPILGLYSEAGLSFIIPELEVAKLEARPELEARRFMWTDQRSYVDAFQQAVAALAPGDTGCALDGQTLRLFEWLALKDAGLSVANARDVGDLFLDMRACKAPDEIANMQRAIDISEAAMQCDYAMGASRYDRTTDRRPALGGNAGARRPGSGLPVGSNGREERFAARRYRRPRLGRG